MPTSATGLVVSGVVYLLAIYGFVWAGRRRMAWGKRHGMSLSPEPKVPSVAEIWNRHSGEMTVIYGAAFVILDLMGLTLWERLGFAALGAIVFGSQWVANSPVTEGLPGVSRGRRMASNLGYWCLSVADWLGYLSVLCFSTTIVAEVL